MTQITTSSFPGVMLSLARWSAAAAEPQETYACYLIVGNWSPALR